jgi:hypothetical protein
VFIKLLKTVAGPKFTGMMGHVHQVDDAHGRQLVAAGAAKQLTRAQADALLKNGQPDIAH